MHQIARMQLEADATGITCEARTVRRSPGLDRRGRGFRLACGSGPGRGKVSWPGRRARAASKAWIRGLRCVASAIETVQLSP
jgi:hypothetical protein